AAADSFALRQLADGEAERREHSRFRNNLQSLSPRGAGAGAALWRVAPFYSGAGVVVWCFDLITIRFLLRYLARPLHLFGTLGMLSIVGGGGVAGWLLVEKFLHHADV